MSEKEIQHISDIAGAQIADGKTRLTQEGEDFVDELNKANLMLKGTDARTNKTAGGLLMLAGTGTVVLSVVLKASISSMPTYVSVVIGISGGLMGLFGVFSYIKDSKVHNDMTNKYAEATGKSIDALSNNRTNHMTRQNEETKQNMKTSQDKTKVVSQMYQNAVTKAQNDMAQQSMEKSMNIASNATKVADKIDLVNLDNIKNFHRDVIEGFSSK